MKPKLCIISAGETLLVNSSIKQDFIFIQEDFIHKFRIKKPLIFATTDVSHCKMCLITLLLIQYCRVSETNLASTCLSRSISISLVFVSQKPSVSNISVHVLFITEACGKQCPVSRILEQLKKTLKDAYTF